jgi:hypothetical protein
MHRNGESTIYNHTFCDNVRTGNSLVFFDTTNGLLCKSVKIKTYKTVTSLVL